MLTLKIQSIDKNELYEKLENEKQKLEKIAYERELRKQLLNEYSIRFNHLKESISSNYLKQDYRILHKNTYTLGELLYFTDVDFIKNCYRAILHREADENGLNYYLNKLRTGKLHKIDIIGRIYLSKESRLKNIKIVGLWPKFILRSFYKIPIIGYISELLITIIRLPKIVKRNDILENHISQLIKYESDQIYFLLNSLNNENIKTRSNINENIAVLENGLGKIIEKIKILEEERND
ncbi:DUF4214 domain-containing protein [Halarcobacter sp.]|uniref:DUF4214 domain-containing protein n=1 Tax=Halarcobacter sp. TaxID=2321133 RepID=UPI002AA665DE|nr:DUF4214 domain-containing protein [Halarcobacter sp.]